ncbi:MAG: hypothetical protein EU533_09445 [Promethearchaeota archaeon]|nr:MAG: hypothetical protein EU533_09445 [Candidatus Lokiarchaeota archaeon]
MPLILILAESGIEIISKELRSHPSVKKNIRAKNYSSQLLDNALHHSAMHKLEDSKKRGRPDILHLCLLNALGSSLNKKGLLELYIHTIHDKIFKIQTDIRITRNFNRFKGLMAKLLIDGRIGAIGSELISPFDGDLNDLIISYEHNEVILFSSNGKLIEDPQKLYPKDLNTNVTIIIGTFQKASFNPDLKKLPDKLVAISPYSLDAWVAVYKAITYYELIHKIL